MSKGEGWIVWGGGACPVGPDVEVEIEFRNGEVYRKHSADEWNWKHFGLGGPHPYDIVAYRVVQS